MCVYIYTHIRRYIYICDRTYIQRTHTCIYIYINMQMYVCMYVCLYIYIYIYQRCTNVCIAQIFSYVSNIIWHILNICITTMGLFTTNSGSLQTLWGSNAIRNEQNERRENTMLPRFFWTWAGKIQAFTSCQIDAQTSRPGGVVPISHHGHLVNW